MPMQPPLQGTGGGGPLGGIAPAVAGAGPTVNAGAAGGPGVGGGATAASAQAQIPAAQQAAGMAPQGAAQGGGGAPVSIAGTPGSAAPPGVPGQQQSGQAGGFIPNAAGSVIYGPGQGPVTENIPTMDQMPSMVSAQPMNAAGTPLPAAPSAGQMQLQASAWEELRIKSGTRVSGLILSSGVAMPDAESEMSPTRLRKLAMTAKRREIRRSMSQTLSPGGNVANLGDYDSRDAAQLGKAAAHPEGTYMTARGLRPVNTNQFPSGHYGDTRSPADRAAAIAARAKRPPMQPAQPAAPVPAAHAPAPAAPAVPAAVPATQQAVANLGKIAARADRSDPPMGSHGRPLVSTQGGIHQSSAGEGDTSGLLLAPWSVNGADAWKDINPHSGGAGAKGVSSFGGKFHKKGGIATTLARKILPLLGGATEAVGLGKQIGNATGKGLIRMPSTLARTAANSVGALPLVEIPAVASILSTHSPNESFDSTSPILSHIGGWAGGLGGVSASIGRPGGLRGARAIPGALLYGLLGALGGSSMGNLAGKGVDSAIKGAFKDAAAPSMPARLISKMVPLGERRDDLEPEEEEGIREGNKRWLPRLFPTAATPITGMMADAKRQGLLAGIGGAALGGAGGYLAGSIIPGHASWLPAAAGIGGALGLGSALGLSAYHADRKQDARLEEVMRRLPPGATKYDYDNTERLMHALEERFKTGSAVPALAAPAAPPTLSDHDKLTNAFKALHGEKNILGFHNDNNAYTNSDVTEAFEDRLAAHPMPTTVRGFASYHTQAADTASRGKGLMLSWGLPKDKTSAQDWHAIGNVICDELYKQGLTPEWDGSPHSKIVIPKFVGGVSEFANEEDRAAKSQSMAAIMSDPDNQAYMKQQLADRDLRKSRPAEQTKKADMDLMSAAGDLNRLAGKPTGQQQEEEEEVDEGEPVLPDEMGRSQEFRKLAADHPFAAGFLLNCLKQGATPLQVTQAAKRASALSDTIALELLTLPSMQKASGVVGDMFSNAGRLVGGVASTAVGGLGSALQAANQINPLYHGAKYMAKKFTAPDSLANATFKGLETPHFNNMVRSGVGDVGQSFGIGRGGFDLANTADRTNRVNDTHDAYTHQPGVSEGVRSIADKAKFTGEMLTGAAMTGGLGGTGLITRGLGMAAPAAAGTATAANAATKALPLAARARAAVGMGADTTARMAGKSLPGQAWTATKAVAGSPLGNPVARFGTGYAGGQAGARGYNAATGSNLDPHGAGMLIGSVNTLSPTAARRGAAGFAGGDLGARGLNWAAGEELIDPRTAGQVGGLLGGGSAVLKAMRGGGGALGGGAAAAKAEAISAGSAGDALRAAAPDVAVPQSAWQKATATAPRRAAMGGAAGQVGARGINAYTGEETINPWKATAGGAAFGAAQGAAIPGVSNPILQRMAQRAGADAAIGYGVGGTLQDAAVGGLVGAGTGAIMAGGSQLAGRLGGEATSNAVNTLVSPTMQRVLPMAADVGVMSAGFHAADKLTGQGQPEPNATSLGQPAGDGSLNQPSGSDATTLNGGGGGGAEPQPVQGGQPQAPPASTAAPPAGTIVDKNVEVPGGQSTQEAGNPLGTRTRSAGGRDSWTANPDELEPYLNPPGAVNTPPAGSPAAPPAPAAAGAKPPAPTAAAAAGAPGAAAPAATGNPPGTTPGAAPVHPTASVASATGVSHLGPDGKPLPDHAVLGQIGQTPQGQELLGKANNSPEALQTMSKTVQSNITKLPPDQQAAVQNDPQMSHFFKDLSGMMGMDANGAAGSVAGWLDTAMTYLEGMSPEAKGLVATGVITALGGLLTGNKTIGLLGAGAAALGAFGGNLGIDALKNKPQAPDAAPAPVAASPVANTPMPTPAETGTLGGPQAPPAPPGSPAIQPHVDNLNAVAGPRAGETPQMKHTRDQLRQQAQQVTGAGQTSGTFEQGQLQPSAAIQSGSPAIQSQSGPDFGAMTQKNPWVSGYAAGGTDPKALDAGDAKDVVGDWVKSQPNMGYLAPKFRKVGPVNDEQMQGLIASMDDKTKSQVAQQVQAQMGSLPSRAQPHMQRLLAMLGPQAGAQPGADIVPE